MFWCGKYLYIYRERRRLSIIYDQLANDSCECGNGGTNGKLNHGAKSTSSSGKSISNLLTADLHFIIEMWKKDELKA